MTALLKLLFLGGPAVWVIFVLGFIALYIIIERGFHLHRAQIHVPEFLRGVINVLKRGNVEEAISICDETPGPVAYVIRAAILRCEKDEAAMRNAVEEAGLSEVPRLESSLMALITVAHVSVLLGLFGTVLGMIGLMKNMEELGAFFDIKLMAGDIWTALLSTAVGLLVAVVCHGFFNYYVTRVNLMIIDMEKAASEMIYFLVEHRPQLGTSRRADAEVKKKTSKKRAAGKGASAKEAKDKGDAAAADAAGADDAPPAEAAE